jgi:hypothetical protein
VLCEHAAEVLAIVAAAEGLGQTLELGRDELRPGQSGENLIVEGLTEERARLGDDFRIGGALLQVTQPHYPCSEDVVPSSAAFSRWVGRQAPQPTFIPSAPWGTMG